MADRPPHEGTPGGPGEGTEGWVDTDTDTDADQVAPAPPAPTGVGRVDAVVDDLARLDERALAEHPGVFEHAHAELRRALDEPPGPA